MFWCSRVGDSHARSPQEAATAKEKNDKFMQVLGPACLNLNNTLWKSAMRALVPCSH